MYVEFADYNTYSDAEIKANVFKAIELGVKGVSIHQCFVSSIARFMPAGTTISSPIDYPYGLLESKIRTHQIIRAAHNGANAVDVVIQHDYIINDKAKLFKEDVEQILQVCKDKAVTPRFMLNYKDMSMHKAADCLIVLKKLGAEYVFPSIGHFADSFLDNIIFSKIIDADYGLSSITNGSLYLPDHYLTAQQSGVFGVRFNNLKALERCMVGV